MIPGHLLVVIETSRWLHFCPAEIAKNKLYLAVFCCIFAPQLYGMKKWALVVSLFAFLFLFTVQEINAQCSICTKTAQQLGEKPAKGMNSGILYLAFAPFAIVGYIGYRWWKNNK